MNDQTDTLDQAEDILTHTVSDEALEAAAGTEREGLHTRNNSGARCC
jgi:hypothetical protein